MKTQALESFERAQILDDKDSWAEAAYALRLALLASAAPIAAAVVELKPAKPRAVAVKAPRKNTRSGGKSLAFGGVSIPIFRRQNCGHVFNSAGCATCAQCAKERHAAAERADEKGRRVLGYVFQPMPVHGLPERLYEAVTAEAERIKALCKTEPKLRTDQERLLKLLAEAA